MTHFQQEIEAQPDILADILHAGELVRAAGELRARPLRLILTLARGSSDNAVTFFSYLAGHYLGLPVASLPPSLFTVYGAHLRPEDALVIAVSQSGESSDVVAGLSALAAAGATTLAVSNAPGSSLEKAAHFALQQRAGPEQAVAASKTFSSQMIVLAGLVAHWSGDQDLLAALESVPDLMRTVLADRAPVERLALRLTHAESVYVLGRGLSYGPAQETALKLKETAYLHAQAYSSAEFQHGPIAAVDRADPVLLLGTNDPTLDSNRLAAERLKEVGADLSIVSSAPPLLALSGSSVPLPPGVHPVTEAFLQVLVGQLLALYLTASKGLDPDAPRHLNKVTKTL